LCNSPGNVPSLTYNIETLQGACLGNSLYSCRMITILTGDVDAGTEPPGSKSVQRIYIDNPDIDAAMSSNTFNISMVIGSTTYATSCLSVHSGAQAVQSAINTAFSGLVRGVHVRMEQIMHMAAMVLCIQFTFSMKVFTIRSRLNVVLHLLRALHGPLDRK